MRNTLLEMGRDNIIKEIRAVQEWTDRQAFLTSKDKSNIIFTSSNGSSVKIDAINKVISYNDLNSKDILNINCDSKDFYDQILLSAKDDCLYGKDIIDELQEEKTILNFDLMSIENRLGDIEQRIDYIDTVNKLFNEDK